MTRALRFRTGGQRVAGAVPWDSRGAVMGKLRRRVAASAVAVVLLLAGAVWSASPASAATSTPWVPGSWVSASVGTVAEFRAVSGGDTSGFVGAEAAEWVYTEPVVTPGSFGNTVVKLAGAEGSIHAEVSCARGSDAGMGGFFCGRVADGLNTFNAFDVHLRCEDGSVFANQGYNSVEGGSVIDRCSQFAHGRAVAVEVPVTPSGTVTMWWGATLQLGTSAETLTTELTCRDAVSGDDLTVSESGTGVAPAPVCPAGSYAVRTKVSSSTRGVLQDASVSVPNGAADYFGGNWQWQVWVGGLPCIAGSAACDAWQSVGTFPPGGDCVILDPDMPSTFAVGLPRQDCEDWRAGGGSFVNEPGSDGEGDNGLKVAIDRVVQAVQQWGKAIGDGIGRLRDQIGQLITCPAGTGCHVTTGGTGDGVKGGLRDGLVSKFQPWIDAWNGVIGGFDVGSPGCQGPAWTLGAPLNKTVHPFDACDEPMSTVAAVFKAALSVAAVVAGLMGCTRVLLSAIGLQIGKGGGEDGA